MMELFSFVPAEEKDRKAVMALYGACVGQPGCTWSQEYPSAEEFETDLLSGWLYCLKEGEKLLGVVSLGDMGEFHEVEIPWRESIKRPCVLARIGVMPSHGGRGLGTCLLRYAINTARNLRFDGIRLLVSPGNPPAIALYKRAGFVTVGETDLYGYHWLCQDLAL